MGKRIRIVKEVRVTQGIEVLAVAGWETITPPTALFGDFQRKLPSPLFATSPSRVYGNPPKPSFAALDPYGRGEVAFIGPDATYIAPADLIRNERDSQQLCPRRPRAA